MVVGLLTGLIAALQVFALVMAATGGGPLGTTDVITSRIYATAWGASRFGDASAMALLFFVLLLGVTWRQITWLHREVARV